MSGMNPRRLGVVALAAIVTSSGRVDASVFVPPPAEIDLAVTKSVSAATPVEGTEITYTITATNGGPDGATGVIVNDPLPAGVTYYGTDAVSQGAYNVVTGDWTVGSLANTAAATLTVRVLVNPFTAGTTITNTATGSANETDTDTGNNSESVDINPVAPATPLGACCLTDLDLDSAPELCENNFTEAACDSVGGLYRGDGSVCAAFCEDGSAACCLADGTCVVLGAGNCAAVGGAFNAGLSCTAAACPQPPVETGGCCMGDTCTQISRTECLTTNGSYLGDEFDCVTDGDSECFGLDTQAACCLADGSCVVDDPAICAGAGGTPADLGTTCSAPICPQPAPGIVGACCLAGADCQVIPVLGCNNFGGFFQGEGVLCSAIICPADLAVTKIVSDETPDEETEIVYTITIANNGPNDATGVAVLDQLPGGVTYLGIDSISQGSYNGATGIWGVNTIADGAFATLAIRAFVNPGTAGVTITNTAARSGVNEPDPDLFNNGADAVIVPQTPAPPAPGTGACCLDALTCTIMTATDCGTAGGLYYGDDVACGGGTCALEAGACCLNDGSCLVLAAFNCAQLGGAFQPGVACADAGCAQPPIPVGACCLAGVNCDQLTRDDCLAASGAYMGDGTGCIADGGNCDAFVLGTQAACCLANGTCRVMEPAVCIANFGGAPGDLGTSCSEPICPPAPATVSICCLPDGTCVVSDVQECNDRGGQFWNDGTDQAGECTANCTAYGACCLQDSSCMDQLSADDCFTGGGSYRGDGTLCALFDCALTMRTSATEKGSLIVASAIELRWSGGPSPAGPGSALQDTFISLTNDYPEDVRVQIYFINGDPPLAADPATGERAHPGWNKVDNQITLTGDQPTYWSALTGLPAVGGVAPFTSLDPGFPPGRPANDGTNDRVLRGYMVAWAVDATGEEIRWNHLNAEGTIVNYGLGSAWEYNSFNYAAVDTSVAHGAPTSTPGVLHLNGIEYAQSFAALLLNFQAPGSSVFSGPRQVLSETTLIVHPVSADLRQETDGPVTTKASFDVWNMNEVKFSGAHRCVTCWDGTRLSQYGTPNNFLVQHLQTDHGKARFAGLGSQVCDVDADPNDGACGNHPDDVCSEASPLLAVHARLLTFDGGNDFDAAGGNVIGMGHDATARIEYDILEPPPEAIFPRTPQEIVDWLERELSRN